MPVDKSLLLRSAQPLQDPQVEAYIETLSFKNLRKWNDAENSRLHFFRAATLWLQDFLGTNDLAAFPHLHLTNGTTGSFENFYQIHCNRKLKVLPGEYPFHRDVFENLERPWAWLQIDQLDQNDFVILSVPFSGDGNIHPELFSVLEHCEALRIPVLIDCAFAGLSALTLPDLRRFQCIQKISFSLSKVFNFGHFRCGFEYCKLPTGSNFILNNWDYGPKAAAYWGLALMQQFPLRHIFDTYRAKQLEVCKELQITPSDTVLFGIGDDSWKEFNRDKTFNRICLSNVLAT